MPTRAIATSVFWQLLSQVVMALLSVVTVKFVAIGLSQELAGNYHSAYGYLQIFGILADFGLYAVALREVSRSKEREKVLGALLFLRIIITACSLGGALLIAWVIPLWQQTPLPPGISIAALVPCCTLLAGMFRTIFQITHTMQYVFVAEVLQRVVTVTLMGIAILSGTRGSVDTDVLYLFLFFGGIGALVLLLLSLAFARNLQCVAFPTDWGIVRSLFMTGLPYGIAYLCVAMYRQFDTTLIALLREDYALQNASYGFALRIAEMGFLVPTYLLNSVLPSLNEKEEKRKFGKELLGKTFLCLLLYGTGIALLCALWATPLMRLLTTEEYLAYDGRSGADTALMLLSLPIFLNALVLYAFYVLLACHAWRPLIASLSFGAIISLILNIWLIPRMGFIGAILSSTVTHLVLVSLLLPLSFHHFPFSFPKHFSMHWIGMVFCLGTFLLILRPFLGSNGVTLGGLIAVGVFLGIYAISTNLVRLLLGIQASKPDSHAL